MQTINIMSDNKDDIKKENQNKVEENTQDTDLEKETENSNENNIENKLSELNDLIPRIFRIIKIDIVNPEYNKKILIDCFKISAELKDKKLVKDFFKLSS